MVSLKGTHCRLRPIDRGDMVASLDWRNDPETRDLVMSYRFPVTETMETAWYDRVLADQGGKRVSFAIAEGDSHTALGFIHLSDIDWVCRTCELGIVIGDAAKRGKGVGQEAVRIVGAYAFQTLNLGRIAARVLERNAPARRMFERVGFRQEGVLRQAAFSDGAAANIVLYGILREEFAETGMASD